MGVGGFAGLAGAFELSADFRTFRLWRLGGFSNMFLFTKVAIMRTFSESYDSHTVIGSLLWGLR